MTYLHAHSASSHDERYAYASGRIRALEMTLLGKQRLERLAEAGDVDEVLRLLSDTVYAAHMDELEDSGYEAFLHNEEARLLDLVDSLSLDREVSDIFRLKYDFHNLKVALREKVSGRELGDLYVDLGRYDREEIDGPVKSDNFGRLPGPLAQAAGEAFGLYAKTQDPADADVIVDKAMFRHFLGVARAYGAPYIETIVRTWIDLANVRTFLRARYLGFESRILPGLLFEGGLARLRDFAETFSLGLDEIVQRFEFSPYRRAIEIGGAGLEKEGSSVPLEREIENCLVSLFGISRYFTFGLEVVLVYELVKQSEIRMLRLIFAGKEKGMPAEAIKERIPDGY
jgi:V/A-type H+-transporting ATPase subunit C